MRRLPGWVWAVALGIAAAALFLRSGHRPDDPGPGDAGFALETPRPISVLPGLREADALPLAPGALAGHSVLLVTLDTTRADHLGCYGHGGAETPVLDDLARSGALFSRAYAPSPTTLPSHASALTGLHPRHHGARANGLYRLSEEPPTLPAILAAEGYATGAVVSAFVLDPRFGLSRGFAHYDASLAPRRRGEIRRPERRADATTDRAIAWLRERGAEPFFLWVHYFDPHHPYDPPAEYLRAHPDRPYDGEIAFVDAQLGRLLAALRELGIADRTLVVATADHGEGLGQHGEATHGLLLYDATLHVPLIFHWGGQGGGVHVTRLAGLVDLAPTVLSLLGVETEAYFDGVDLTAPDEPRPLFMETLEGSSQYGFAPLLGVRLRGLKYIFGPAPELYDVDADPMERIDVLRERSAAARQLRGELDDFYGGNLAAAGTVRPTRDLSAEEAEQLRALGYLTGGGGEGASPSELPDPKAMMPLVSRAEAALALAGTHPRRAIVALETLAREYPDLPLVRRWLAELSLTSGDVEAAGVYARRLFERWPDDPSAQLTLARVAVLSDEPQEAVARYQALVARWPRHGQALLELGAQLLELGRADPAAEVLARAAQVRPRDLQVLEVWLGALSAAGRSSEGVAWLEEEIARDPENASARAALAGEDLRRGDCPAALSVLRAGSERHPDDPELGHRLATALLRCESGPLGPPLEASRAIERVVAAAGDEPAYLRTQALIYLAQGRPDDARLIAERALAQARRGGDAALVAALEELVDRIRRGG